MKKYLFCRWKRFASFFLALLILSGASGCTAETLSLASASSEETLPENPNSNLVINEVVSSNKQSLVDPDIGSPDWVELFNPTDKAIVLSGYGLSDNLRNLHKFLFEDIAIGPGEYLVIYCADNSGLTKTSVPCTGFGLSKSGDKLFLTDNYYGVLSQVDVPALLSDVSYARRPDGSYGFCATPTPGSANTEPILSSMENLFSSIESANVRISEVMPNPADGSSPWVELYNAGESAVLLDSFYLSDRETNLTRWQIPAVPLDAGSYVCIYLSGKGTSETNGIHSNFKLGNSDTYLYLSDSRSNPIDSIRWEAGIPDGIAVIATDSGVLYTSHPTMESANSPDTFASIEPQAMATSDPVHISEVVIDNTMTATDSDGDYPDWCELVNYSSSAVSLNGYYLSDNPDNLFKWAIPDITLPAGGYLLIFLSGKNRIDNELHTDFKLSSEESEFYLTSLNGLKTETVPLSGLTKKNISVGYNSSGQLRYYPFPTPGYQNAKGFETAESIGCFDNKGVFISEVSGVHEALTLGNDWVELCNGSDQAVDLSGWYLSDSQKNPTKWAIPSGTVILPGGYLVIEANSHVTRQTEQIAAFGIGNGGETLVLSDPSGHVVDCFTTGALSVHLSSGRIESDPMTERVFFTEPTPGARNSSVIYVGKAPQPTFSHTNLYHSDSFDLTIFCRDPNATIYYTLDGDEPNTKSKLYSGPIKISKNTPVRAKAYVDGLLPSEIMTANFLFEQPHTVPVVCVTGNPTRVQQVMRINDKTEKIERAAYISYYEPDGTLGTQFPAGIKPKGAGTVAYSQKSLSINLRSGYGQNKVTYPFFPDYPFTTFGAIVVRNGGQDWSTARIRDAFCNRIVSGMHVDNSANRPCVVYINGSYNGLYDLMEDQNSEYLATHYGLANDNVDIIRRNQSTIRGDNKDIKRVREFGDKKNLADDALYQEYLQWIDVEFFTDYFIAQTYFCNSDMFNQKYWRARDYQIKWRPIFYDIDFGFASSASRSMISQYFNANGVPSADGTKTYFEIYIGLRKNAGWRAYAVERYVECIYTFFDPDRVTKILDELVAEMEPEMPRQIKKWHKPSSMSNWKSNIHALRKTVEQRPEYALEQCRKFFGVSKEEFNAICAKYKH